MVRKHQNRLPREAVDASSVDNIQGGQGSEQLGGRRPC